MIHILPRIEYSIDFAKSSEDINSILNSLVDSGETLLGDALNAGFSGEVNPSGFKIISDVSWIYLRKRFSPVAFCAFMQVFARIGFYFPAKRVIS